METIAVMAKYNPFFERAGMRKVWEVGPPEHALAIRDYLIHLGFDVTFLGSPKYVLTKLESLGAQDLLGLREVFKRNVIPRLLKEFFFHLPYGKAAMYREALKNFSRIKKYEGRLIRNVRALEKTKKQTQESLDSLKNRIDEMKLQAVSFKDAVDVVFWLLKEVIAWKMSKLLLMGWSS